MPSHVRPATEEDKGLARTFADKITDKITRDVVAIGETKYGLRVIPSRCDGAEIHVLMPLGQVLVKDIREMGREFDQSIRASGYAGDMTLSGEVADANSYSCFYRDVYLRQKGDGSPESLIIMLQRIHRDLSTGPDAKEKSLRFLQDAGICGADGQLTPPYRTPPEQAESRDQEK